MKFSGPLYSVTDCSSTPSEGRYSLRWANLMQGSLPLYMDLGQSTWLNLDWVMQATLLWKVTWSNSKLEPSNIGCAATIEGLSKTLNSCLSAPDGRRDFFDSTNCWWWPSLYKSYEATYTLKCLFFEKITKNWFLAFRHAYNQFSAIFSKTNGLRALNTSCVCHNVLLAVILHPLLSP